MSEQIAIQLIPSKIKIVLKYIDQILMNPEQERKQLVFSYKKINDCDTCVLKVSSKNKNEYFNMGILAQYDKLLYSRLLISLLDNYLDSSVLKLSSIFTSIKDSFTYSFCLLTSNQDNVSIIINSKQNLDKIVNYYNERVSMKRNQIQSVMKG